MTVPEYLPNELAHIKGEIQHCRSQLTRIMEAAERSAVEAIEEGMTEVAVAEALGVDRMTVRKWLGKR